MPGVGGEPKETLPVGEKMALAQRLLQQSPPGEFADVLQGRWCPVRDEIATKKSVGRGLDICAILDNDDSLMSQLHEAVRERNLHSGTIVTVPLPQASKGEQQSGTQDGQDDDNDDAANSGHPAVVKVPLTTFNELPDEQFFDPDTGTIFAVNHYNLVLGGGRTDRMCN